MPTPAAPGQLRNLDQLILDNVGGLEAVWLADVADVVLVPDPDEALITADVVLRLGASWYQVLATRTTLSFTQPGKSDRHGPYWQPKLRGVLAWATPELLAGLEALDGRRFLALYRDQNGLTWLVGTPDAPLAFSASYDAGSATARNNFDFVLTADVPRRARPYQGTWQVGDVGLSGADPTAGVVVLRTAGGRVLATVPAGKSVVLSSGFKLGYQIV